MIDSSGSNKEEKFKTVELGFSGIYYNEKDKKMSEAVAIMKGYDTSLPFTAAVQLPLQELDESTDHFINQIREWNPNFIDNLTWVGVKK